MSPSKDKSGPSVQISAKAEAKVGLQATVPENSVGRLVDSLTDIIRPFSESRGLRADQIRLQREDVAIKIALKAAQRLKIERANPKPVPNKIMVPLLEAGSTEDVEDDYMIETWGNLLASASKDATVEPRLVGILRELQGRQAKALERIAFNRFKELEFADAILVDTPETHYDLELARYLTQFFIEADDSVSVEEVAEFLSEKMDHPGIYISHIISGREDDDWTEYVPESRKNIGEINEIDLRILESLSLLRYRNIDHFGDFGIFSSVIYYHITQLGLRLLSCCGRLTPEIEQYL